MRLFLLALLLLGVIGCNEGGVSEASASPTPLAIPTLAESNVLGVRKPLERKYNWSPVATEEAGTKPPDLKEMFQGLVGTPAPSSIHSAGSAPTQTTKKEKPQEKDPDSSNEGGLEDKIPGVKGVKELLGGVLSLAKFIFLIGLVVFIFTLPWMIFKFFLKIPIWIASLFGKIFRRKAATSK